MRRKVEERWSLLEVKMSLTKCKSASIWFCTFRWESAKLALDAHASIANMETYNVGDKLTEEESQTEVERRCLCVLIWRLTDFLYFWTVHNESYVKYILFTIIKQKITARS